MSKTEGNATLWVGKGKCVCGFLRGLSDDEVRHAPAGADALVEVSTKDVGALQGKAFKAVADADGRAYWVRTVGAKVSKACPEYTRVYLKSM